MSCHCEEARRADVGPTSTVGSAERTFRLRSAAIRIPCTAARWGFWFLPTVVPAGALPRNRLASSATGGASAICPLSRLRRQLPQRGSQAAGASAFRGVRYENLSFQQAVGADAEKGGQGTQLDIRDEALACLDALHGVFRRQVKPHPSHRQGPGTAQGQADGGGGNCTPRRDKKSPAERCSAGDF